MKTSDFDFNLPHELIAQYPPKQRSDSRLMCVDRASKHVSDHCFTELPSLLREGDLLVLNDTRVIPARLAAQKKNGKRFEILLMEKITPSEWKAMVRPGKDAARGIPLCLLDHQGEVSDITARVYEKESNFYHVRFTCGDLPAELSSEMLERLGNVPLPPYIERSPEEMDINRYQTVFAHVPGSVAAPTAGLHFTEDILNNLQSVGIQIAYVTLHVGPGTFAPVKTENLSEHPMHEEAFILPESTATAICEAKKEGRRVIPVGTTSMRVIESAAREQGGISQLKPMVSRTRLFIYPPADFYVADALLTNFHFPKSTLLMLVSAFASPGAEMGRELILQAYRHAIEERYRFFSYGDAMLIT